MHPSSPIAALVAAAALLTASGSVAQEFNPVAREPRSGTSDAELAVIIKLRVDAGAAATRKLTSATDRGAALARRTSLSMKLQREISDRMLATRLTLDGGSETQALAALRADPEVEYVAVDHRRYAHATTPNDTLFNGQWFLQATEASAVNAIGAWDRERGSSGVVIAVLDTGILYGHPDLGRAENGGKLLPGFDFVANAAHANDGDGRDADPSDPGDWVSDSDRAGSGFSNCALSDSSWHGTRVAGMIGALTNNGAGVAGMSWGSPILPVRVLGKCGGVDSDILAGMRWAAGLHVNGVADNPNPARILNMSLGSSGVCEPSYRDVIAELTARKVLVVISAGNEGTVVSSPANCPGVAAVAAIRHAGSKVGFSSLGPEVTLAAPGGNCVNVNGGPCLFSLDTTSNSGTTTPAAFTFTNQFNNNLGTSFSAPIVSGIAALMLSRNNNLSTAQLLARLREGARPFPTTVSDAPTIQACHVPVNDTDFQLEQCLCTTATCGAGMADAANSVVAAERPIAAVSLPANVSMGQTVAMDASGSAAACGRTITAYSWTVVSPTVNPPAITGANTANATVIAPAFTAYTLRLTVTDDQNRTDSADIVVEQDRASSTAPASAGTAACAAGSSAPPPPPTGGGSTPPPSSPPSTPTLPKKSGGGGGGGSLELVSLILLGALATARGYIPRVRVSPVAFARYRAIFAPYAIDGSGSPLQLQLKALRQVWRASRSGAARPRDNENVLMSRIYDRLESATLHFARSGAIKERLERAWRQCLSGIDADDLPHELRLQFLELAAQMQRERPLRGEDALRATIRKMSNEDAERHAAHIVRMFCRMTRQRELDLPLPALPNSSAHVVQLFAAEG